MYPSQVTLVEVGPRDGLQNEATPVAARHKVELVHRLQAAGLREMEVTSFVSPKWVPQMADNAEVMAGLQRLAGVRYAVLTPNLQGLQAALASRPDEVVVFAAASEAFSLRNINCSIDDSLARFAPVVEAAHAQGIKVRGAISCALGCPYQGEVSADEVERVVRGFKALGVDHCGVADTLGVGTPAQAQAAMARALKHYPLAQVSGHFHDTYGQALANIHACLHMGVHTFDASVGGLGGCPYAKGATGNVATEDVLYLLNGLGVETGVDIERLVDAAAYIAAVLGRPVASRVGRALLARRPAAVHTPGKLGGERGPSAVL
jgi:hydroxymethylglutaryl-CoA lyase